MDLSIRVFLLKFILGLFTKMNISDGHDNIPSLPSSQIVNNSKANAFVGTSNNNVFQSDHNIFYNRQLNHRLQRIMIRKHKNNSNHPHKQNYNLETFRNNKYGKISIKSVRQETQIDGPVPYQQEWQEMYNRRQSSLNAMFNKRKQILEDISKKNKHIYIKINNQETHYPFPKIHKQNSLRLKDNPLSSQELIKISKTVLIEVNNLPTRQLQPIRQYQSNNNKGYKGLVIRKVSDLPQQLLNSSTFVKVCESRYERQGLYSYNSDRVSSKNSKKPKLHKINDIYINF